MALALTNGLLKALLEFFLKENVQFGLELVLCRGVELLTAADLFLELFDAESEDSLLEASTNFSILIRLSEFGEEFLSSLFS